MLKFTISLGGLLYIFLMIGIGGIVGLYIKKGSIPWIIISCVFIVGGIIFLVKCGISDEILKKIIYFWVGATLLPVGITILAIIFSSPPSLQKGSCLLKLRENSKNPIVWFFVDKIISKAKGEKK